MNGTKYSTRCTLRGEPEEFDTIREAEEEVRRLLPRCDVVELVKISIVATYRKDISEKPITERRTIDRTPCGVGGCNLVKNHAGDHRGACGCINGCYATGCPNQ